MWGPMLQYYQLMLLVLEQPSVPVFRLNELATVEACTGSLNVAVSEDARTTPVAPLEGLVSPVTVGGVVSPEMLALVTVIFALAPSVLVKY